MAGPALFGAAVWLRIDRRAVRLPGSTGGTTYLVVGSDSRGFATDAGDRARFGAASAVPGERVDIALLVRRTGDRVTVLDVPRDLMVLGANGAPTRYALTLQGGLQSLVDTTCGSLGIAVDHVVLVHFDGLRDAVDAVGGVDVVVPGPLRDPVTGLAISHGGRVHLDGQQALALVRSRDTRREVDGRWEPVAPSASERGDRARTVLASLGARAGISPGAPVDAVRKLLAFSGAVTVDDSVGPTELRRLTATLGRVGSAREVSIPVRFHAGAVPEALAEPGAPSALRRFAGPSASCAVRLPLQTPGG